MFPKKRIIIDSRDREILRLLSLGLIAGGLKLILFAI